MKRLIAAVIAASAVALSLEAQQQWTSGVYVYDGSGNIVRMGTDEYRYDGVNRVKKATAGRAQNQSNGEQSYGYDSFGNRVSATTCYGSACFGGSLATSAATNHLNDGTTYNDAGAIDVSPRGGVQHLYAYDPAGMMSSQTASGKTVQYVYAADDHRLAAVADGEWRWALRGPDARVVRDVTSKDGASPGWTTAEDYVQSAPGVTGNLSAMGRRHTHLDHLGTPRVVTDDSGRRIGTDTYFAFGEDLDVGSESPELRLRFAGHERDAELAGETLDYLLARYYDASVGRFLSADRIDGVRLALPQSWNRYVYGGNNPLRFIDPNGWAVKDFSVFWSGKNNVPGPYPELGPHSDAKGWSVATNVQVLMEPGDNLADYKIERDCYVPGESLLRDSNNPDPAKRENPDDPGQVSRKSESLFVMDAPGMSMDANDGSSAGSQLKDGTYTYVFEVRVVNTKTGEYDPKRFYYALRVTAKSGRVVPGGVEGGKLEESTYRGAVARINAKKKEKPQVDTKKKK
jgi:RHS repeat-associated protein